MADEGKKSEKQKAKGIKVGNCVPHTPCAADAAYLGACCGAPQKTAGQAQQAPRDRPLAEVNFRKISSLAGSRGPGGCCRNRDGPSFPAFCDQVPQPVIPAVLLSRDPGFLRFWIHDRWFPRSALGTPPVGRIVSSMRSTALRTPHCKPPSIIYLTNKLSAPVSVF